MSEGTRRGLARRAKWALSRAADPVVSLMPSRAANLLHTRLGDWDDYFRVAEGQLDEQWDEVIWPAIQGFDFETTLELSPGAGRNAERLSKLASRLIVVDYNQDPLNRTRKRLGDRQGSCTMNYYRNNGFDLSMVPDDSVTAIYCWDSAVHFDKFVMAAYIREFARVLRPGGSGFLHHSNLGGRANSNINRNPDWRSNTTNELVAETCQSSDLTVVSQEAVPWTWSMDKRRAEITVDSVTVFSKPECTDAVAARG